MQWTQVLFFEPNLAILGLGASILAAIVIYNIYREIQLTRRSLVFALLRVLLLVIVWQLIYHITALIVVGGGSLEEIRFKQSIVNTISYGIILVITYFVEKKVIGGE